MLTNLALKRCGNITTKTKHANIKPKFLSGRRIPRLFRIICKIAPLNNVFIFYRMIQRIQTVYLLLAAFILALPVWLPYAVFKGIGGVATYNLIGAEYERVDGSVIVSKPEYLALILTAICAVTLITAIFPVQKPALATGHGIHGHVQPIFAVRVLCAHHFSGGKRLGQPRPCLFVYGFVGASFPVIAITLSILAGKKHPQGR